LGPFEKFPAKKCDYGLLAATLKVAGALQKMVSYRFVCSIPKDAGFEMNSTTCSFKKPVACPNTGAPEWCKIFVLRLHLFGVLV